MRIFARKNGAIRVWSVMRSSVSRAIYLYMILLYTLIYMYTCAIKSRFLNECYDMYHLPFIPFHVRHHTYIRLTLAVEFVYSNCLLFSMKISHNVVRRQWPAIGMAPKSCRASLLLPIYKLFDHNNHKE